MRDFTLQLGQLGQECEVPMYSFSRVSSIFWSAFLNELIASGMSEKKAKEEIQSKGVRWMLDSEGEMVEDLAKEMAKGWCKQVKR